MITTVDIEKYFQKNKNNLIKFGDCVSLVAWISGFLINCQGKKQFFEKNKDIIIRKGEYDYTVNKIEKRSFKKIVMEKVINQES